MIINPISIDINPVDAINNYYKTYQDKKHAKFCKETDFKTGHIAYEDGVFLPDGTYVLIKEKNKPDVLGKIVHCKNLNMIDSTLPDKTAIVNIFYEVDNSIDYLKLDANFTIGFINKLHHIHSHYKEKYLQVVECKESEDNKWKFVRIEYGNPNVKMFYMYGWQYYDNNIYEKKDLSSNKLKLDTNNRVLNIYKDVYNSNKLTNIEYKIKPSVLFVPNEVEYFFIYLFLMAITFIFEQRWLFWTVLTIIFLIVRNSLRKEYNG